MRWLETRTTLTRIKNHQQVLWIKPRIRCLDSWDHVPIRRWRLFKADTFCVHCTYLTFHRYFDDSSSTQPSPYYTPDPEEIKNSTLP